MSFLLSNFSIYTDFIKELANEDKRSWPAFVRSQVFNRFKKENDLAT
jgi:hypothetical protein